MSAKTTKGSPKLAENVAGLKMERDGEDLVIRLTGLYSTRGVATATDKDTRKLASSPGMFYWTPDGSAIEHRNPENRRLGLKVTAILGKPRDLTASADKAARTDGKVMSAVSIG